MTNKYRTISPVLGMLLLIFPALAIGQVQLNGSVDFELSAGGDESAFITNRIPRDFSNAHLAITQLNALLFAPISDTFFFEGRVQLDTWGDGRLNQPRISLASLTWSDPSNSYILKLGRFVSPFGFYADRQLSRNKVFVANPLGYNYFVNISDIRGYWPQAGNNTNVEYEEGDVGLSTIYFANYTTGIGTSWEITPNTLTLDAAITNGTPITQADRPTLANIAGTMRLQYNPAIFWNQGFSLSYGTFMQADPLNEAVRQDNDFQQYRQFLAGTDTKIAFTYFEIIGEVIFSNWNVPRFSGASFTVSGDNELLQYNLSNVSGNIDIKYEPPFLTGSYIALRAEYLRFLEAEDPQTNERFEWDDNVSRLTGVLGYKVSPSIITKASFSEQSPFNGDRYALRIQVSALF